MNRLMLQAASVLAIMAFAFPGLQPALAQSPEPSSPNLPTDSTTVVNSWGDMPPAVQRRVLDEVSRQVALLNPSFANAWSNLTQRPVNSIVGLAPVVYDAWMAQLRPSLESGAVPDPADETAALVAATQRIARVLGLDLEPPGMASAASSALVTPTLPTSPSLSSDPAAICAFMGDPSYYPYPIPDEFGDTIFLVGLVIGAANCLVFYPVFLAVALVLTGVAIAEAIGLELAAMVLGLTGALVAQADAEGDRIGDDFQKFWDDQVQPTLVWTSDFDLDGLDNVKEFRWNLVPICTSTYKNCRDWEQQQSTGSGGDGWMDGQEVLYWNDASNDGVGAEGVAFYDPDRLMDLDNDTLANVNDPDSDGDGLLDGQEAMTIGSYPEFRDSDCSVQAIQCSVPFSPASGGAKYHDAHVGNPGTGDGVSDQAEQARWAALGANAATTDFDGDSIGNNLLDPDSDGDGLLDGEEFTLGGVQVRPDLIDTDLDGLIDGNEVAWSQDTDLDGRVNANDQDSDDDGMPDHWESTHFFNMVDPTDALTDRDGDQLTNLGEYLSNTNPDDMDSEGTSIEQGDLLLDGEEVNSHGTNPLYWDTDNDGLPDRYEVLNALQPKNAADAGQDPDSDGFDQGNDGSLEKPWPNLAEYKHGRPATWNETRNGPWLGGTLPHDPDSDDDGASDGYEAYYNMNPLVPADTSSDNDKDGLTFAQESETGTDPNQADTDRDGLCDGGRGAACLQAGLPNQPGEADYGTRPWTTDSDSDLLSDGMEALLWDPSRSGVDTDVDGDGLGGTLDRDADDDGLLDGAERYQYHTDPAIADTDGDEISDGQEVLRWLTNPLVPDTDGDSLTDGLEVALGTNALVADSDADGLDDGVEATVHGTDPLSPDTDSDGLGDAWEVSSGTQPRLADAEADPDGDSLTNFAEWLHGTAPLRSDTENDGMPDDYEVLHGLDPRLSDRYGDKDWDDLKNLAEYQAGTLPRTADTDKDGLSDGWEVNVGRTKPLEPDTDLDGMDDGPEYSAWQSNYPGKWSQNKDGDAFANVLLDPDSDNDGLLDSEELRNTRTRPDFADTDGDGLTDFTEVVTYQGQYDPNRYDTDGDGQSDSIEVALADTNGDYDKDGLKNGDELAFGTDFSVPDSDCDGIQDGPEASYWDAWNFGGGHLLDPDVDGDGLSDGVEIGWVGTPQQAMYRTEPDEYDTDRDLLSDSQEAHNSFRVACGQGQGTSASRVAGLRLPTPLRGQPFALVQADDALRQALVTGQLYKDASGLMYGIDSQGLFAQGGYGVRLYAGLPVPLNGLSPLDLDSKASGPGTNGKLTDPLLPDTDGDGLSDGEETLGGRNSYSGRSNPAGWPGNTDPWNCDSDKDGLGDGLEAAIYNRPIRSGTSAVCMGRDRDPSTTSDPNDADTDGDSLPDGVEDGNRNGGMDARWDGYRFRSESGAGEGNPIDGDTDDDGLKDSEEGPDSVANWDRDGDGLSDGLELGRTSPVVIDGLLHTKPDKNVLGLDWPTWQPFQGTYTGSTPSTTLVSQKDSDGDGLLDGLEDLNHNGKFGDTNSVTGKRELHPMVADVDEDGRSDGHELLAWGIVSFQQFIQYRGSPYSGTSYDESPLKTDPLVRSTDQGKPGGDTIPDGKDINPRGDGLLMLQFTAFWQHDMIERTGDRYETDLALGVTLKTGVGDYAIKTLPLNNFGRKDGNFFSWVEPDARSNPSTVSGINPIARVAGVGNAFQFDLPDNIEAFTHGRDTNVRIQATGWDVDDDGSCDFCWDANKDDPLDLSDKAGNQFIDQEGVSLTGMGGDHADPISHVWVMDGNGDHIAEAHIDAKLQLNFWSTVVPYFLKSAMGTYAPQGQCFAGASTSGGQCNLR